jgi:hypothetical protein
MAKINMNEIIMVRIKIVKLILGLLIMVKFTRIK